MIVTIKDVNYKNTGDELMNQVTNQLTGTLNGYKLSEVLDSFLSMCKHRADDDQFCIEITGPEFALAVSDWIERAQDLEERVVIAEGELADI
tara:strand:- start:25 stop:300 length:276 start_codon:yes stop_codon:yes gene_type:complete